MIPTTDGPLEIFVDIFIFEVSKINDIELTMTFELYFDLMWEEKRFVINETSDKWGQVNQRNCTGCPKNWCTIGHQVATRINKLLNNLVF